MSAKSTVALSDQADRLLSHLREQPESDPADVGWSLAESRTVFEHRAVIIGADRDTLLDGLQSLAHGRHGEQVITGSSADDDHRVVFVFPGQGSQWLGMAQGMLRTSLVFTAALSECDRVLRPLVGWSVLEVLNAADEQTLERVDVVQPVLFAVMVSLAAVWRSLGVTPDAVVGHSQGEIAAAHVAGGLSLADAALIVARRSQLLVDLSDRGGMLSVPLPRDEVAEALMPWRGELSIAAVNGPRSTVVSGAIEALNAYFGALESDGVRVRRIPVDYAAHSKQVEQLSDRLRYELRSVAPRSGAVPLWSTVTGGWLDTAEMDSDYWYRNLREPVEFEEGIRGLVETGHGVFVEVSAHPVVTIGIQETIDDAARAAVVAATLRRDRDEATELLRSAGELFVAGVDVRWGEVFADRDTRRMGLPTYAFQRKRFWLESVPGRGGADALGVEAVAHPMLGAVVELPSGGVVATARLSLRSHGWLGDHRIAGVALLPGTGFVELLVAVGDRVGCGVVEELTVVAPLSLPDAVQVRVAVGEPDADGRREANVHARADVGEQGAAWTLHASAILATEAETHSAPEGVGSWPPAGATDIDVADAYERVAEHGYDYGPVFQGLRRAWRRGDDIFAEIALPSETGTDPAEFLMHPALLDSALHVLLPGIESQDGTAVLPFGWRGARVYTSGAEYARVRITPVAEEGVSVWLADERDIPIMTVDMLSLRPIPENLLRGASGYTGDSLYELEWITPSLPTPVDDDRSRWVVLGEGGIDEAAGGRSLPDLAALTAEIEAGGTVPAAVLVPVDILGSGEPVVAGVYRQVEAVLALLQSWLAEARVANTRLIVLTRNASGIGTAETASAAVDSVSALAGASVWGLVRSAQSENPDRFVLVDTDGTPESWRILGAALDSGESQLVLRAGQVTVPRLTRVSTPNSLVLPQDRPWRIGAPEVGSLDALDAVTDAVADRASHGELTAGQVRISVRAAGVNFRDVLMTLGMYPDAIALGSEGAGVVDEVGPGVTEFAPGDRVMGIFPDAFAAFAIADQRMLAPMPSGWSFEQAAAVPVVYLTAYYGLVDLAGLRAGESVLIHAAAGGVGMAAVQLAKHLGAEVFATASPAKFGVLRELGVDDAHIASSRTLEFETAFAAATAGRGVDVVLNSLAYEFLDASLRLTATSGRFIEMGKTDLRDPQELSARFPDVTYRAYDVVRDGGAERIQQMLAEILALFRSGALRVWPVRVWEVNQAREAFRFMREGRHIGKNVLRVGGSSPVWDGEGTVLITGGSGTLGAMLARHVVTVHGVRRLLLVSRRGESAAGFAELRAELIAAGADSVRAAACDVTDRAQLAEVLAGVDPRFPVRVVVHTAGMLDDGVITSLTGEQLRRVLAPKVDAAWNLHELTRDLDLRGFVLYSSSAAMFGAPGQGNYAAGNAFLDGLARYRHGLGLPATSLAWGLWEQSSGMTGHLRAGDRDRMNRGGLIAMSDAEGHALLDRALTSPAPVLVPAKWNLNMLRANGIGGVFAGLAAAAPGRPGPARARGEHGGLPERLAALPGEQRHLLLTDVIGGEVAAVLGYEPGSRIDEERAFKDLGFDSLTAVELRNRLTKSTGLRLPTTLIFDYPDIRSLTQYIADWFETTAAGDDSLLAEMRSLTSRLPSALSSEPARDELIAQLQEMLDLCRQSMKAESSDLDAASDDELFALANELD
ncbi:type I polyketide synthase [Nocardia lijiangensis]|uniref:type I polyketide synthase n=1 Tax=Nocardia lijiangensis TaxID=299618 RepID=UPI001C3F901B|nr:type I polyketide synthase [Nocardia lijiangensis]